MIKVEVDQKQLEVIHKLRYLGSVCAVSSQ